jgi:hypothetical protein
MPEEQEEGWPWCEPCHSYHHTNNPTCVAKKVPEGAMSKEEVMATIGEMFMQDDAPTRAFLLSTGAGMWMCFGRNAVEAATMLPSGISEREISVSGMWSLDRPIDLYKLWPYYTANPSHTESFPQ